MNRYALLRYERGITQEAVAEAIGVDRMTILRLENGHTDRPTSSVAKALADFYEITVADLLGVTTKDAA